MLEHFGHQEAADAIQHAISQSLKDPSLRTADLGGTATTQSCGRAIAEMIE